MASPNRDHRWETIVKYAPSDTLIALAKERPSHSIDKVYRDQETRVDEVFRVCPEATIDKLYEEYPGPFNFVGWLYRSDGDLTKAQVNGALQRVVGPKFSEGIEPQVEDQPRVYKVERSTSSVLFRCVARDREQNVPVSFGQTESITLLSYYDAVIHFSDAGAIVFGAYSAVKAKAVLTELDAFLKIDGDWVLLKPENRKSRDFYTALKAKLSALLVETKRHDPTGDYRTIALQARDKHPDLENVPNFAKYLAADSYFDVLQYDCRNAFGLKERVRVKFGRPFGRFTFGPNTSISAIKFFESKVSELLR